MFQAWATWHDSMQPMRVASHFPFVCAPNPALLCNKSAAQSTLDCYLPQSFHAMQVHRHM